MSGTPELSILEISAGAFHPRAILFSRFCSHKTNFVRQHMQKQALVWAKLEIGIKYIHDRHNVFFEGRFEQRQNVAND